MLCPQQDAKRDGLERETDADDPRSAKVQGASHGRVSWEQEQYIVEDDHDARRPSLQGASHAQFSSGNGGEYRKTFHGFAPGYAVVVDSPSAFQITPMQIDTWNREEMDISGPLPPKFVPGPLPRGRRGGAAGETGKRGVEAGARRAGRGGDTRA